MLAVAVACAVVLTAQRLAAAAGRARRPATRAERAHKPTTRPTGGTFKGFDDVPFDEALRTLAEQYDLNIVPMWRALERVDVDRDTPVYVPPLKGVMLRVILELVLDSVSPKDQVGYKISGNVIQITTKDKCRVRRVYRMRDLIHYLPDYFWSGGGGYGAYGGRGSQMGGARGGYGGQGVGRAGSYGGRGTGAGRARGGGSRGRVGVTRGGR
jgi:hypothetical protein